jgi:hypothetical protein
MVNLPEAPKQLRVLALVWLLIGVFSMMGNFHLNLELGFGPIEIGAMGLVFAPGLVLAWRWVSMVLRWLSWFTIVVCFMVAANGVVKGGALGWVSAAAAAGLICLLLEQLHVLKEPEVLQYYQRVRRPETAAPSPGASPDG